MDRADFLKRISQYIKNVNTPKVKAALDQFLDQCTYVSGVYDQDSGFQALEKELQRVEAENRVVDRLFYMALPPSVFIPVANGLKKNCYTKKGINRLIVEKPFGMDLESSRVLSKALGALYREDEVKFLSCHVMFFIHFGCICHTTGYTSLCQLFILVIVFLLGVQAVDCKVSLDTRMRGQRTNRQTAQTAHWAKGPLTDTRNR